MHASLVYGIHLEIPCVVKTKYRASEPNERTTIQRTFSGALRRPLPEIINAFASKANASVMATLPLGRFEPQRLRPRSPVMQLSTR